jgi:hypothetical protein
LPLAPTLSRRTGEGAISARATALSLRCFFFATAFFAAVFMAAAFFGAAAAGFVNAGGVFTVGATLPGGGELAIRRSDAGILRAT